MEPPLDRSTTWAYVDGEAGPFHYARNAHPVGVEAERALGALDGGEALLFSSGMGATTAVVLALLDPGRTVALAEDAYYGTGVLLTELERWGLRHVLFDQTGPPPAGADLVWLEAPSNPLLTMPDLEAAAAHPGLVLCDATAATPVHLRPLEHGCDLVLHSATKYLGGHHDVQLGAVVAKSAEHAARLHEFRTRSGIVAAPDPSLAAPARPADAGAPRPCARVSPQRRWLAGSRHTRQRRTSAIPASAGSSRSTSPTATRRGASRRRRR